MKVIAFNGSPNKDGNTAMMLNMVLDELRKEGIETELVHLDGNKIRGCTACRQCFEKKNGLCAVGNDMVNECITKMVEADGILLGSPTYFTDVSTEMKALIDRAGLVSRANGDLFKRKVAAAVVAVRRGGSIHAFDTMNHFFQIGQMVIVSSTYWNMGFGMDKGEVKDDEEGVQTMQTLGQNMAWALKKLYD